MATISFKVPEAIRQKMGQYPHINWSEVLRSLLLQRLEEMAQQREIDRNQLEAAIKTTDQLRRPAPEGWSSTEVIRHWREHRP